MACNPSKNYMEVYEAGNRFMSHPSVKKIFKNPSDLIVKKFAQLFGHLPSEWKNFELTKPQVKLFKGELKYMLKHIKKGKIGGIFGSNLYTTSAVARRNPHLAELYNNFLTINYEFKGRQGYDTEKFSNMMNHLAEAGTIEGLLPSAKSIVKSQRLATKYQQEIENLRIDQANGKDVNRQIVEAEARMDKFLNQGEGAVFKEFITMIESKTKGIRSIPEVVDILVDKAKRPEGRVLTEKDMIKIKNAIHNSGIAKTPQMADALTNYIEMMHKSYHTLELGVEAYINAVKEGMAAKGVTNIEKLKQVETKLRKKLLPDEKIGYYPHFRYDLNVDFLDGLMPKLQKLSSDSAFGSEQGVKGAIDTVDLFEAAVGDINTYLSKRIKPRTKNLDDKLYSMNFPVTVKRYLDEINRFNFIAHTQLVTRKVLNDASKAFKKGKDLEGYGRQFVEMVMDLHHAQTGTRDVTGVQWWNNLSRGLLNLEFASKLGLNIRSAAKNSTQYLLNLVEFGPIMMLKSRKFYNLDPQMKVYVEESMRESGLKFTVDNPELLDYKGSKAFKQNITLNDNNQIEFTKPSKLSQFADGTSWLAGKSGFMMRGVENFNRESTYKVGFYKMWTELAKNPRFKEMMNEKFDGKMTSKQWEDILKRKSKAYAENMVNLLHFDYSSVSKSKLMRTDVGRFMFQFQHYSHKFLEYNLKLGREARHSALSGDFSLDGNVGKAFRMGLVYFGAPALVTAFTERDMFRFIEHESAKRIANWFQFFTGDEEEVKQASYGRGALGALVGAPVLSDFLTLGELAELWELDDDDWTTLLVGYSDAAMLNNDQKAAKLMSIANIQLQRSLYKTSDMAFSGYPERALAFELNIFPTKRAKLYKEMKDEIIEDYAPDPVLDALDWLDERRKRGNKRASVSSKAENVLSLY